MGFTGASGKMVTDVSRFYGPAIPALGNILALSIPGINYGSHVHEVSQLGDLGYYRFTSPLETRGPYQVKFFQSSNALHIAAAGSMTYGSGSVADLINLSIIDYPGIEVSLPAPEAVRELHYDSQRNLLMGPCERFANFCNNGDFGVWNLNTLNHQKFQTGAPILPGTKTAKTDNHYYIPLSTTGEVYALNLNTMSGSKMQIPGAQFAFGTVFTQGNWQPRPAY